MPSPIYARADAILAARKIAARHHAKPDAARQILNGEKDRHTLVKVALDALQVYPDESGSLILVPTQEDIFNILLTNLKITKDDQNRCVLTQNNLNAVARALLRLITSSDQ